MGSVINCDQNKSYPLAASVIACGPIESLVLYRGKQVIQTVQPNEFTSCDQSNRFRIAWKGSRIRGRGRRVNWDGNITVKNAKFTHAQEYCIDTPTNGITNQSETSIQFTSQTTGDADGLDITLDNPQNATITFNSDITTQTVELNKLTTQNRKQTFDCGGLDMQLTIERYPISVKQQTLTMTADITPPASKTTPYFIKATQTDGQMAWSSPIYLKG